jgi:hypothetical protein
MDDEQFMDYPFAEIDSYFGELELFDDSLRRWTVTAKNTLEVFTIPKNDYLKLFKEDKIRHTFFEQIVDRFYNLRAYHRECGRNLRRWTRVKDKLMNRVNSIKLDLQETVVKLNQTKGDIWYDHLEDENKLYKEASMEIIESIIMTYLQIGNS